MSGPSIARDIIAGVTVAAVLIPQAVAYASVAGMPPVAGLYAAALPPLAAALFASSPYLQTGPVAVTSLLTLGALSGRAPIGTPEYVEIGMLLALIVGTARLTLGALRLGVIAHFMSEPMMMGFVPAAALLIVASQVPAVLGAPVDGGVLDAAAHALGEPAAWNAAAVAFAVGSVAVIYGCRRLHRWFPGVLAALAVGIVVSHATSAPVSTVGTIPAGMPEIRLDLPWHALPELLLPGVVIAVVGFAEPAAIARTLAIRERRSWSADREFIGQGAANVAAAVSGGYPVGGSLSRTSLNHAAGAATRFSGAVTGGAVLLFLPIASTLASLPQAVLAAIVIVAVVGLLQPRRLLVLWTVSRPQAAIAWTTFAATLAFAPHVERAVIAGGVLAILVHLARELRLHVHVATSGDVLDIRLAGVLWFATAPALTERVIAALERHSTVTHLRLDLVGLGRIDLTGAMTLHRLVEDARRAGLSAELRRVPGPAQGLLQRCERQQSRLA